MITAKQIYWITRLDDFKDFTLTVGIIGLVALTIGLGCSVAALCNGEKIAWLVKSMTVGWLISLISLLVSLFIPTTKQVCAMWVIPKIANNEQVQEIPDKIMEVANEWIDEIRPHQGRVITRKGQKVNE